MKILLSMFALCLTLLPAAAHAQEYALDRGSMLVDGSASFTSTGYDDVDDVGRRTELLLAPGIQYFVLPGLAVGGALILIYAKDDNTSATSVGGGPEATYFFTRGERPVSPFVSASVGLQSTRFSSELAVGGDVQTESSLYYRASGGVLLLLSRSVGITGELFYQEQNSDDFGVNTFGLAFGISAFVF